MYAYDVPTNPRKRRVPLSPQKENAKPSVSDCLIFAGKKNGVNLALDAGGAVLVLASAKFQIAAAISGSALGMIGIGVSVANKDAKGAGLAFVGKQTSTAGGLARVGSSLARGASRFGAAAVTVSTARDLAQTYDDYQQCGAGAGQ